MESMSTTTQNTPTMESSHIPLAAPIFNMNDSLLLQIQNERHIINAIKQCLLCTQVQLLATKAYSLKCIRVVRETEERYLKVLCASEQLERAHASIRRLAECNFADGTTSQSLEEHAEGSTRTLVDLQARVAAWESAEKENRDKVRAGAAEAATVLRAEEEEVIALELSLMRTEQRLSVKEAVLNGLSP
jgi:hypothetical protein